MANLQERRDKFLESTLFEVENSTHEILKIRHKERTLEFAFKFPVNSENYFVLHLNSAGGSITSGKLTIFKQGQQAQTYNVLPFPFLFLHELSIICVSMQQQIKYVSSNRARVSLPVIDSIMTSANQAQAVLSDLKFTQIEITDYIDPQLPPGSSLMMDFNGGNVTLTSKSISGIPDGICENLEDATLLLAINQLTKRIVKSLRFLRSDIQTWGIGDDDVI